MGLPPILLAGDVPLDGPDHFFVPFEVPAGTREIAIRHEDLSDADILDWGLDAPGPDGTWVHRGWGGGNGEDAVVGEGAASRSYVPGPIPAGTWRVVVGKAKLVTDAPRYELEVTLRDTPTLPAQPERRPFQDPGVLSEGARWYAGDTHVHSRESGDASATLDEIAELALAQGLDFVVVTDHDVVTGADFLSDAQARWPTLLFVPGTEYTTYDGHATAAGARTWVDHRIGQPGVTIDAAARAYADAGVFFSINHPALDLGDACIGCAWGYEVPEGVAGIEIGTGGVSPVGHLFTPGAVALWESVAAEGRLLVPVGGSDDHRAGQDTGPFASPIGNPVTMVYAESLSIAAILDGLHAGATVVKLQDIDDPMVELAVGPRGADAAVTGAVGQRFVWVVDGAPTGEETVGADPESFHVDAPAGARIRAEVWIGADLHTVTAFGVVPEDDPDPGGPADPQGCRCAGAAGGPGLDGALVALAVLRRRRPAQ